MQQAEQTFRDNAKKFYRELGNKAINIQNPPSLEKVELFWSKIWKNNKTHNDVPTGSKTRPRKTSMSQLRNGQTSPQRRPSEPYTRPATG